MEQSQAIVSHEVYTGHQYINSKLDFVNVSKTVATVHYSNICEAGGKLKRINMIQVHMLPSL